MSRRLNSPALLALMMAQAITVQTIPDSPKGFDKQIQEVVRAFKQADEKELSAKLDEFALPARWFVDAFGAEKAEEFANQYATEFKRFKADLVGNLRIVDRKEAVNLKTKLRHVTGGLNPPPKPAPPSLLPLPPAQYFRMELTANGGILNFAGRPAPSVSWMQNFVYVHGKFRYWGGGAYPFWDRPKPPKADPCNSPDAQTGGRLLNQVAPVYPTAARRDGVMGSVKMRITVRKDGTVRDVEFIEGHLSLRSAAREAILQWRYEPFLRCGVAVEKHELIEVKFSLP